MGRRLAEATKACRVRRTRGEIVFRLFFVLVEVPVFLFVALLVDEWRLAEVVLAEGLSEEGED